jgi:uncharacterized protein (DUF885 family)
MSYREIAEGFHELRCKNPIECTWKGIDGKDSLLPDLSEEYMAEHLNACKELIKKIDSEPRDNLSFDEELDLDLAKLSLQKFIFSKTYKFNGKTEAQQMPSAGETIGNAINPLFVVDERDPETRLNHILQRLGSVRRYLRQAFEILDTPVKRWVEVDLGACAGFPFLLDNVFKWAESIEYSRLEDLRKAKWEAEDAVNEYMDKLEELETTDNFSMGDSLTREWVKLRGIPLSLEELHQMAKDFFKSNNATLEELRTKLVKKYNLPDDATEEQVTKTIQKKHRLKMEEIIPRYKSEQARVNEFIAETGLFPVPEGEKLVIDMTPRFLIPLISVGAIYLPKAFSNGIKKSLIYLTVTEDRLDDQNSITITNIMIHEGKPGHHLHFANALTNPSTIRKHVEALRMTLTEGWATNLESYMIDVGFVDQDLADEARFLGKREFARLGARVAIDLYFMTGDEKYLDVGLNYAIPDGNCWEKAAALLMNVTSYGQARAQGELNWYSQQRGYPLSYLVGNTLFKKLKLDMKTHNPEMEEKELDKLFHETYVKAGFMPITFMRRVFEDQKLVSK